MCHTNLDHPGEVHPIHSDLNYLKFTWLDFYRFRQDLCLQNFVMQMPLLVQKLAIPDLEVTFWSMSIENLLDFLDKKSGGSIVAWADFTMWTHIEPCRIQLCPTATIFFNLRIGIIVKLGLRSTFPNSNQSFSLHLMHVSSTWSEWLHSYMRVSINAQRWLGFIVQLRSDSRPQDWAHWLWQPSVFFWMLSPSHTHGFLIENIGALADSSLGIWTLVVADWGSIHWRWCCLHLEQMLS